jgi:hypothetical protein
MYLQDYKTSFTSGGLFFREALKIAELYASRQDWTAVRRTIRDENALQTRTQAASIRTGREALQRVQALTAAELQILLDGSRQEQNQILWLAACKHYPLVREFASQVIREKFLRMDLQVSYLDYDIFFNEKSEWHAELEKLTALTKKKLRQVLFRMLREAEITTPDNAILPAILSPRVGGAISADDPALLSIYPISDAEIQRQVPS